MAEEEEKTPVEVVAGEAVAAASAGASPPAAEPPAQADGETVSEGEDETSPSKLSETEPQEKAKPERDWKDHKIARLAARLRDMQAKQTGPAAELPVPSAAPGDAATRLDAAAIEARARELASQQSAIDTFNRMCNEAAQAGRKNYNDFDSRVKDLQQLAGETEEEQIAYNQFIAAALETGEAPRLLHELAQDLDEAARIMSLPPVKMGIELQKRASAGPTTQVSGAPRPITPVGGRSSAHVQIDPTDPERADRLSTAEWMRRREAQANQARGQRR